MSVAETEAQLDAAALLAAARGGDGEAFRALMAPHLPALRLHCYRMLGSLDEADDAVQESLLRAWRSLHTYRGDAPLRHWLYRITTTSSLKLIEQRGRRPVPAGEVSHLQPYPDRLLDQLPADGADPAAIIERRETVTLAFISALQRLPASQRAVLILRDVLAWTAREVAELLEVSVASVNSALQRARATLATAAPGAGSALSDHEQQLLRRFVDAWERCDIPALAAVLREDVELRMPPEPSIAGRDRVTHFFATVPAHGRLDQIRLVVTGANRQPAVAAYLRDWGERCQGYGIMVFTVADGAISVIHGFPRPDLFDRFGLPLTVD
ncbi:MAG TPA: RNA polymerase subunit sigma-70 [Natronosporangium sp.]